NKASELLRPSQQKLLVHVSGKYPALRHSTAIIQPLAPHPVNRNGVIVYDASVDPQPLLEMSVEAIRNNIYTAADQLPEGQPRIPLKVVHINKSPMLAPLNTLNDELCQRLQIDLDQCEAHRQQLLVPDIANKVQAVFEAHDMAPQDNPDLMLYQGGFFSSEDRQRMNRIRGAEPAELAQMTWNFDDTRLPEMLFRYRARNYPQTLNRQEQQKWRQQCLQRLTLPDAGGSLTLDDYFERLDALVVAQNLNPEQEQMVELLIEYGEQLADSVADV
ncbi:MAG TPA: exodeoxyribonuclease I, partial [Xanthomonadales bacterium]|nr:exodeoxyribonuclease I [Xanthomonadales bacterium]